MEAGSCKSNLKRTAELAALCASVLFLPSLCFASAGSEPESGIAHVMANLAIQLAVILFAARAGGLLFEKFRQPSVLGELVAGIVIGPFLLGAIALPAFPNGLFPLSHSAFSVGDELYAFASVASVILLFVAGLETDLNLLMRFSIAGLFVGLGGATASFFAGAAVGSMLLHVPLADPRALFLGVISTATSVGISIRVLSEKRRVGSPEGVTILAAAVIDDVLGIILLAVVIGFAAVSRQGAAGSVDYGDISAIAVKAVVVWLGFTALGLMLSNRISAFLKLFGGVRVFSVLGLGLALLLAGIFEKAGLAMIIGAYVMGLTLSKTDVKYVVAESIHPLYEFFVPLFFTVTGMLVDIREIANPAVLALGAAYAVAAIVSKVIGCGVPALFLNFNRLGALRIGLGMTPRCEVAIIITGIGLSYGIINHQLFGVSVLMTLVTSILTPPLLNYALNDRPGTRRDVAKPKSVETVFELSSPRLTDILASRVLEYFREEGFFIHTIEAEQKICHIRRQDVFLTMYRSVQSLRFDTRSHDVRFVKTIVYESLVDLHDIIDKVKSLAKPADLGRDLAHDRSETRFNVRTVLDAGSVVMALAGETKQAVIEELLDVLVAQRKVTDREHALAAVLERERSMSTGMQHGVAIPHAKTDTVSRMVVAVGLKPQGIDFESIDGQPSRVFFLVLSPTRTTGPHIQFLAFIASVLHDASATERLLTCTTPSQVVDFLTR